MKKAIILMGPPGAGKGTQAELLAYKFDLVNFDTGRYLEDLFRQGQMSPKMRQEFRRGDLLNPVWTLKLFQKQIERIAQTGIGIVFNGSPRTIFEAFGEGEAKIRDRGVMSILLKHYGKKNIIIFELVIPPKTTILRNSKRKICSVCWRPHLLGLSLKNCPFCGGKMIKRVQDKPSIIKHRLKEYEERTKPVLRRLKREGFKIIKIDGRPKPNAVFKNIEKHI